MPALPDLGTEASLGELPNFGVQVDVSIRGGGLESLFHEHSHLPGVIVSDGRRVCGMISRQRFLARMALLYSRDLYLKRPLRILLENEPVEPLRLASGVRISRAAGLALARPMPMAYEPVLVAYPSGELRVVDVHTLLRAQSLILEVANREKDRLLGEIGDYAGRLETTLAQLRETQDRLVQERKMAALGQLVAGVAHEINTPVGVAITAVTHLQEVSGAFKDRFDAGKLKKSDVSKYIKVAAESSQLIYTNLLRAGELVRGFRQVSADHTSSLRRRFRLKAYLKEVLLSLKPRLKEAAVEVELSCPREVEVDSYQ